MSNIEIIDNERTIEEVESFFGDTYEQSQINTSIITSKNNVFLTSLIVGASLVSSNDMSAKTFELKKSNKNEIATTYEYNETVNEGLVKYINNISKITKRQTTKQSILKNILSYKSLTESWDGYDALPLEIESAANSIQLIDLIGENIFCSLSNSYPNPNGTITFEWENSESEIVSLEVGNKSFSYYVELASMDVMFFNNKSINATEAKKISEFIQVI